MTPLSASPTSPLRLAAALAAVYVIWGSTYLAIAVAVRTLPPLLMAGARFIIAGAALYAVLRLIGTPAPQRMHWRGAAITGALLLGVGNGIVCLVAHAVPTGAIALIIATTPLWMVLLPWSAGGARPTIAAGSGIVLGLAGVVVLVWAPRAEAEPPWSMGGVIAILAGALAWAWGSLWSKRIAQPPSPLMATAAQMLCGGAILLAGATVHGEWSAVDPNTFSAASLGAFAYLVVVGSIAGFGAYVWLLRHAAPAVATSYAFVNPLVAIALGWWLNAEPLGGRMLIAAALIVVAVVVTVLASARRSAPSHRKAAT